MSSTLCLRDSLLLCVVVFTLIIPSYCQVTNRVFPGLFNAAYNKPVTTIPTQSTCGTPTRTAFCVSSPSAASIIQCQQEFCVQTCPRRDDLPTTFRLLQASGFGACVSTDMVNRRPGSSGSDQAVTFTTGPLCYLTPLQSPTLGANGAFTVTVWMWPDARSSGTIVEKFSSSRDTIFKLSVTPSTVDLRYRTNLGLSQVVFAASFPQQTWSHVAIQIYHTSVSLFVNGTENRLAARETRVLLGQVIDESGVYRVGQSNDGQDQFVGKLQDVYFFGETLTNREINLLYSGTLPVSRILSSCRCPPTHPRVRTDQSQFCILNGVSENTTNEISRLHSDSYPLEFINDGDSSTVWISDSLDDVTVDIDLGDQFQVFYVVLQFYSPGPHIVTIERQTEVGGPWLRWQLYAQDCTRTFGLPNNGPLDNASSVNCLQFNTNNLLVPYSKGNITFSVLSSSPVARPGYHDFYNTPELTEFVKVRRIRVRMQGHFYVTHPRHNYYGVYEYIVTGRCNCHGHAETCDNATLPYTCHCVDSSNTEGDKCDRCLPLYNDKPFRDGTQTHAFPCVKCECYDHADACVYNSSLDPFPANHSQGGGGVCVGCRDNTEGRQCDVCVGGYYRPEGRSLYANDVCQSCDCDETGTEVGQTLNCSKVGGDCNCKLYVGGRRCDQCLAGYYNLLESNPTGCLPCNCFTEGAVNGDVTCHQTLGQCNCKANVRNRDCSACDFGYYNLSSTNPAGCSPCDCHPIGSLDQYCHPFSGQCQCRSNMIGRRCDQCSNGFTNFTSGCTSCGCNTLGTEPGTQCNIETGQCACKLNVIGSKCDTCQDGYYQLGGDAITGCMLCGCNTAGSAPGSLMCNKITGACTCKVNVQGLTCNQCKPNTFRLAEDNEDGCEDCQCDPSGTLNGDQVPPNSLSCDQNTGQCTCLTHRIGRRCEACDPGYYLNAVPGGGCSSCDCHTTGSVPQTNCDEVTGQCVCLGGTSGIGGRRCDSCLPGYFYQDTQTTSGFQCVPCECDPSGSTNTTCNPVSGRCQCKLYTEGRQCGRCQPGTSNLQAHNPYGCSKAPSQQPPPQYRDPTPHSLYLSWLPPDYPNGVIIRYDLYRDNVLIATTTPDNTTFNDTGLEPFTDYTYVVEAYNELSSTRSPSVTYRTLPGSPSGDLILSVTSVTSRSATFSWSPPTNTNGVIQRYVLTSTTILNPTIVTHYNGSGLFVTLTDLQPYMRYNFTVGACTDAGCLYSAVREVWTLQALPEGQAAPQVSPVSSSSLYVTWAPPEKPNGIIIFYELWLRGADGTPPATRVFHPAGQYNPLPVDTPDPLPPPATNYTIDTLQPYTLYELQVLSENQLGKAASPWVPMRTLPDVPLFTPPPVIIGVSSSALNVTWSPPNEVTELRGAVERYRVYHYAANDLLSSPHAPPYTWKLVSEVPSSGVYLVVDGLPAFSNETFVLEACNSVGCVNSSEASGQTLLAAPEGLAPPEVTALNMSSMEISWSAPSSPNGPPPVYTVNRRETALNSPPPSVVEGTRFPGNGYYKFPAETIPQGVGFTGIQLRFKTQREDGLLVFAASEGGQEEFISLQMRDGRPWFLYDPQGCTVFLEPNTSATYSDDQWHHLLVKRRIHYSTISIDFTPAGCGVFVTTWVDEGRWYSDNTWHHVLARRTNKRSVITLDHTWTSCASFITTTDDEGLAYNDGEWHHFLARRRSSSASIQLDNTWEGEKVADCASGNVIGANTGVYVGGLPDDYILQRTEDDERAEVVDRGFMGCVRDVSILVQESPQEVWQPLNWSSATTVHKSSPAWEGCPLNLQAAYHFVGTGYATYRAGDFSVTRNGAVSHQFQLRTEFPSGLLFFVYGQPGIYYLVQLVDGAIQARFSNGALTQTVTFNPPSYNLCDGNFYYIRVTKQGQQLRVEVQFDESDQVGSTAAATLDLTSDIYVAGLPSDPESDVQRFITESALRSFIQPGFGGCLQDIRFTSKEYKLEESNGELVDVYMDGCPQIGGSQRAACTPPVTASVYNGSDTVATDHDLLPFTEYIYQVEAENQGGSVMSAWSSGRTREAPPFGVTAPYDIRVLSGYVIQATWVYPTGRTGRLTRFILQAQNADNMTTDPVTAEFTPTQSPQTGQITTAVPFTNYTLSVVACTAGGCTGSEQTPQITTAEEVPGGVALPSVRERGAEYIVVEWSEAGAPNGVITGYILHWERQPEYTGAERHYNVTGLVVYTGYRFAVEVCNRAGCTSSEETVLSTAQLPPTHMDPPILTVLGTSSIYVEWLPPEELNGDLQRYLLYVSSDPTTPLNVSVPAYNSSALFLYYTLRDLTPGTTYAVAVAACTGGGCRMSNYSTAETEESAPDGLTDPIIVSPSPSELNVSWEEPRNPNGVVTEYRLHHNGLLVFNSSTDRHYLITNLQPWSLHYLRVEACTLQGCASSQEVMARTMEAPPEGTVGLEIGEVRPREVDLRFTGVLTPNGDVIYQVYFSGLFYADPDGWDYTTLTETRSLYQTSSPPVGGWVTVDTLLPNSAYNVHVNASNSAGYILSPTMLVNMPMAAPDGVHAPVLTSPTPRSVRAVWRGVERNNADLPPTYQLQTTLDPDTATITNVFPQPTTSNTYLMTDLRPYSLYYFRILAINRFGETPSEWAGITTKQDSPGSVDPPMVSNITSRSVTLVWTAPLDPHGVITEYRVYTLTQLTHTVDGNVTELRVEGLVPDTSYMFSVAACTEAGCTLSPDSQPVTTLPDVPAGLAAPTLTSHTPTSVTITWSPPTSPNGALIQYGIERRRPLPASQDITLVQVFLPTAELRYQDTDATIKPATSYQYRVLAQNAAGRGYSDWASVTTRPSRPGGVVQPSVNVLGPFSLEVQWQPPLSVNGRLERYIVKLPQPRVEVTNTSQTSLLVDGLTPYTQYTVTVTACSDGGCTESTPAVVRTSPYVPQNQPPPTPTPHSPSLISVLWQPPLLPNGPNLRYELARIKIRQPLVDGASGFDTWTSVFVGTDQFYEDSGLSMFTTYQYRVTAYTDFGYTTSPASPEVTTFGGTPTEPAMVSVSTTNHTSLLITWITPDVIGLQGEAVEYIVDVRSVDGEMNRTLSRDASVSMVTVANLQPNTDYDVTVTIVTHGGANITSDPQRARTLDGAPEGLPAPIFIILNQTAIRVAWLAPVSPNGEVTGYTLYWDGVAIDLNTTLPGSRVMSGLEPYVIYIAQMGVCTEFACTRSELVQTTTAESLPQDLDPPRLTTISSSALSVVWDHPTRPNGIILRYELHRKEVISCSDRPVPTPDPQPSHCTYLQCGILESFCGDQCYSGTKTCCDGVLHDNKAGYECCGQAYIPQRTLPNYVCCGGQFHQALQDHQCCGDRFVEVPAGQVCCVDPSEDRVVVGPGHACCHHVPYYTEQTSSQVCCMGKLYDGYENQCCGETLVSDHMTCCGNATQGTAYEPDQTQTCCGQQYITTATSSCCTDSLGHTKVHMYGSAEAKLAANDKCCGVERVSVGLSCCNNAGYNPALQTCADRSDMDNDCGSGVICPVAQSNTAFCDVCTFDRTTSRCGSYQPDDVVSPVTETVTPDDQVCTTDPVKVYTGTDLSFQDVGLQPYTEYIYTVSAVNGAGATTSDPAQITTAQAPPTGLAPPTANIVPGQLDVIYLQWEPPTEPNGILLWYSLTRDDVEIFRHPTELVYIDDNTIRPYRTYTYQLTVCNVAGCVTSEQIRVATLQAKPEQVSPPSIRVESSTAVLLTWSPPGQPNGNLRRYELYEASLGLVANLSSDARQYRVTGLEAYHDYSFLVSACTEAGCTNSSSQSATTSQGVPQGLAAPRVVVVDSMTVEVYWQPPVQPNGQLQDYLLYRNTELIRTTPQLNTTDTGLSPGLVYMYTVGASTGGGGVNSSATSVTLPMDTPVNIPAPTNVSVVSATSIAVRWTEATVGSGGRVDQYRVVLNAGTSEEIVKSVGLELNTTVSELQPYTLYSVRIRACLEGVANGCGTGPGVVVRTLEAPPEGQPPPTLDPLTPQSINISWDPPLKPNGLISQYRIHRRRDQGSDDQGILIHVSSGSTRTFLNTGPELRAFTSYQYRITALNSQGQATSDWSTVLTPQAPPRDLSPPTVTLISAYTLTITWQPPGEPNGIITIYRIEYRVAGSDISMVRVSGDVRSTALSGLQPYKPHEVRVTASNDAGSVTSDWTSTVTSQAPPSGVGPFTVEKITDGRSVILRWSKPTLPNGIINSYGVYESGNINAVYRGSGTEFEYRRLAPYTAYVVQLEACTNAGCTKSPMQSFYTAEIPPENQEAPTLGVVNATHVTLSWGPPVNAFGKLLRYEVLRRRDLPRQKRELSDHIVVYSVEDPGDDQHEFTDSDLDPYTDYDYSVRSQNSQGSTQSPWLSITTSQAPPTGVNPPIVSQISGEADQLQIQWDPPTRANGIIQYYQIRRNDSLPVNFAPDDPMVYIDRGLVAHTVYAYVVRVCTAGGCTTSSPPSVMRTPETAPFSMDPPVVTPLTSTDIQVTWSAPALTNGMLQAYHLKVNNVTLYSGLDQTFTVTNLTPYQAYIFHVEACTFGGCTASKDVIGRPLEAPPTGQDKPILQVLSSTSIEITWGPPQNPNGVITTYEIRRDGSLIDMTLSLVKTDNEVSPGQEYTYTITAVNSQGSTTSPPTSITTYPSSPSAMDPPTLEALSSTSIRATWNPPANPNGLILNYTLYQNRIDVIYSALGFTTISNALTPYTEYTYRIEACTSHGCALSDVAITRTLEATPVGMSPPRLTALADGSGVHSGVMVDWSPPLRPNGVVVRYELYRRPHTGLTTDVESVVEELLYSGEEREYRDTDTALQPYTRYEYSVLVANSAGQQRSSWMSVLTREAPPEGVRAPLVKFTTSTTIRLELLDPEKPNGNIETFRVYLDGELVIQSRSSLVELGDPDPLTPYTTYTVHIVACTAGGCTASPTIDVITQAAPPNNLLPPNITNINSTSLDVTWDTPLNPNGPITGYQLSVRQVCPHPYADDDDQVVMACSPGPWSVRASGLMLRAHVSGLTPYTRYQVQVDASNEQGSLENPPSVNAISLPAPPVYLPAHPPRLQPSGNVVTVDWTESFQINGEVDRFVLYKDGVAVYTGTMTTYNVYRTSRSQEPGSLILAVSSHSEPACVCSVYELRVQLVTSEGEAESSKLLYDPSQPDSVGSTRRPTTVTTEVTSAPPTESPELEFYQETWFILVLALLAVILIIIIVILVFRCCGGRSVHHRYTRERGPLNGPLEKPTQPIYYPEFDPITTDLAPSQFADHQSSQLSHVSYINPVFSQLTRDASFIDADRLSGKSWGADDDDWNDHVAYRGTTDSGLHSLAFGDEYDAASERPISVLKEHTMFSDTHL